MDNSDQIEFWNGPAGEKWVSMQGIMDANFRDVTARLLPFAEPQWGERVLDIGCGAGQTSYLLAEAVGSEGHVTGVDISAPLLAAARRGGPAHLDFVEADASTFPFKPEFDLVFSRFGVMFFADPPSAFENVRAALKPSGRLAFVCWRRPDENEWVSVPLDAARKILPPQPAVDPLAAGPFAFSDPERVRDILSMAGFRDVTLEKLDGVMDLGGSEEEAAKVMTELGPTARLLGDADADTRMRVQCAVRAGFAAIKTDKGIRPALACWLVSARR